MTKPPLDWIRRSGSGKPSVLTNALNPNKPHSLGIKPHPHGHSIAKSLLNAVAPKPPPRPEDPERERRPLIDRVHAATFEDPIGLQWVRDKYALRTALRKATCFTLGPETSALISDFSFAVAADLDSARRLATPPYPVTWIDIDNRARLARIKELGGRLTTTAASADVVDRVGWLITSPEPDLHVMTYFCEVGQGILSSPLQYKWHTAAPSTLANELEHRMANDQYVFGLRDSGINVHDATLARAWLLPGEEEKDATPHEEDLMLEISGELRHVFGLLVALAGGTEKVTRAEFGQAKKFEGRPLEAKGKTLLPLEHKTLTIHLNRRMTAEKAALRTLTGAKKRWHTVRTHLRHLKSGKIVKVREHERGEEKLGKVTKTYRVEK